MLISCGQSHFLQLLHDGSSVVQPILRRDPNVLFRDSETALQIKFEFNCANMAQCGFHSLSKEERGEIKRAGARFPNCDYHGSIVFLDSFNMISSSLDNITQDLNLTAEKIGVATKDIFRNTYIFMANQGYTNEQFQWAVKKKVLQPFEKINYQYLIDTVCPPPIEHFYSKLRGVTKITPQLRQDYQLFKDTWDFLEIEDYYSMMKLYVSLGQWSIVSCVVLLSLTVCTNIFTFFYRVADSVILLDAILYFFGKMWTMTTIYPSFYPTHASYALSCYLFNGKDPVKNQKPIAIPFLSKKVHKIFEKVNRKAR